MKKEWLIFAAILAYLIYLYAGRARPSVAASDAHELVKRGALLLDVRTPSEFASGHIDGAENIPLQELGGRLSEIPSKDSDVIVYCRSGHRSSQAKAMLEKAGFSKVHDLGGMNNW
jgi:rhodanese-related sulfurtransferase